MKIIIKNGFYIFLPIILGSLIGLFTSNFTDYNTLIKPPLAPPKILFPIVWSIIYLLMGIAYFIYKKNNEETNYIYYIQLILKWKFISVLWIILLDILIILTMKTFKQTSKISYYLFIPYLIWCIYATYLTIGIFILN